VVAKARGIQVAEIKRDRAGIYDAYIKVVVALADGSTRRVAGTVFSDGRPRLIQIRDLNMDAEFAAHMLYVINEDKPGMIGRLGTLLGEAKVNIAAFALGRSAPGADAIALVEVDGGVDEKVLAAIRELPSVKQATLLEF
jgi:D-3-phosphoglycerate dehydrogenase